MDQAYFYTQMGGGGLGAVGGGPPTGPAPALQHMESATEREQHFEDRAVEMDQHVQKLLTHVATSSTRMANEFMELSATSASQLHEVLARTAQFSEVLLQSCHFVENETDVAVKEAMAILGNIQEIHKGSESAQRLLFETKGLGMNLGALEAMLSEMEAKRGIPSPAPTAAGGR